LLRDSRLDIVFERSRGDTRVIEIASSATRRAQPLLVAPRQALSTCERCDAALEWSADGRRLLVGIGTQGLQILDRTGVLHTPTDARYCDPIEHATLSPIGDEIACQSGDGFEVPGVPKATFEDRGIGDTSKWGPAWSPDGGSIAYVEGIGPDQSLKVYSLKTRKSRRLPAADLLILSPAWSHDGQWLAFANSCQVSGCDYAIWIVRVDGTNLRRIARHGMRPAWSSDGRSIAFDSHVDGDWEIRTVVVATGKQTQLTRNHVDDVNPSWR
jgi:hypothetical protein